MMIRFSPDHNWLHFDQTHVLLNLIFTEEAHMKYSTSGISMKWNEIGLFSARVYYQILFF